MTTATPSSTASLAASAEPTCSHTDTPGQGQGEIRDGGEELQRPVEIDIEIEVLDNIEIYVVGGVRFGSAGMGEDRQRIAFVSDNFGNIIELAEPGTWPTGRQN